MRVTQTISIGSLRINSMSNSSILQIGTSGSMKARSEEITETIPGQAADQKIEGKITQEVEPLLNKQGLPVGKAPPYKPDVYQQPPAGQQPPTGQQQAPSGGTGTIPTGPGGYPLNGGDIKAEYFNNYTDMNQSP